MEELENMKHLEDMAVIQKEQYLYYPIIFYI